MSIIGNESRRIEILEEKVSRLEKILSNEPKVVRNNECLKKVIKPQRCNKKADCYNSLGICVERHCSFWFMTD